MVWVGIAIGIVVGQVALGLALILVTSGKRNDRMQVFYRKTDGFDYARKPQYKN
jgi:hypothetical protein